MTGALCGGAPGGGRRARNRGMRIDHCLSREHERRKTDAHNAR
jgi:hypothetical protein